MRILVMILQKINVFEAHIQIITACDDIECETRMKRRVPLSNVNGNLFFFSFVAFFYVRLEVRALHNLINLALPMKDTWKFIDSIRGLWPLQITMNARLWKFSSSMDLTAYYQRRHLIASDGRTQIETAHVKKSKKETKQKEKLFDSALILIFWFYRNQVRAAIRCVQYALSVCRNNATNWKQ